MTLPPAFRQIDAAREQARPISCGRQRIAELAGAGVQHSAVGVDESMIVVTAPQADQQQRCQDAEREGTPLGSQEVSHLPIVTEAAHG